MSKHGQGLFHIRKKHLRSISTVKYVTGNEYYYHHLNKEVKTKKERSYVHRETFKRIGLGVYGGFVIKEVEILNIIAFL